ncbi:MAG: TolC family protein [Acidobacteriaceae bacterium]|nr:TolC family protein [Acidobacteriaceae bacterium]
MKHTNITQRASAYAALLLLQINMAWAVEPVAEQALPSTPTAQQSVAPFDLLLPASHNPLDAYRGKVVPPPNLSNSVRLDSLVRDGKLYLSLQNAIDLALENNLDLVIARYNLPIAQMDVLRTKAGASARGVNTGIVSGTPGGAGSSFSGTGGGAGAGGTSGGAGGAGAGASGLVQSTLGAGTPVSSYDPVISATGSVDHVSQLLPNQTLYGVPTIHQNSIQGNVSYAQAFPTGGSIQAVWNNSRQTTNSPNNMLNPQLNASVEFFAQQPLLAGFGFGPNLRFLRIAKTTQKVSDIAFRAQLIATITQICNLYWDLVEAYGNEQAGERSVAFASATLETSRKQLELQAVPEMEVLKAEGELATRQQDLTIARTNLQLQELYLKNTITRSLDDPVLQEMPVIPVDHAGESAEAVTESAQEMIASALRNRTELQESSLVLQNSELSRKTARNAMLPQLSIYGFYLGTGYGGTPNPLSGMPITGIPNSYGGALKNALNYSSPEYQAGFQLEIPLRNRAARADQYRTELEYRQSQVYLEELKKRIRIEVRNARYTLEQGASRVESAQKARDLAARTLDIMQKEQKLGAGSSQQTLSAEHDLTLAESALVTARTAYEKARIELKRSVGSILEDYGISIDEAKTGVVDHSE